MKYRVLDFVWANGRELVPHPEARIPIAAEDAEALQRSVADGGLIQPLLVIPAPGEKRVRSKKVLKKWWVVDGVNRWKAVKEQERIPCVVVELGEGVRVRDLALECASVGRSRSAGQRIMVYLERNKEAVLEAAEIGSDFKKGSFLKKGVEAAPAVSRDTAEKIKGFSSEAISETLGVSKKDTLLAIDLLRSHEGRVGVSKVVGGLREEGKRLEEGDPELKAIDEAWAGVLAGTTPIRRWKAAVGGKKTTKEVGRAAVNWSLVGHDGLVKVGNALGAHWQDLTMDERLQLLEEARKVAAGLPREVREVFAAAAAKK